jgi:hypothetical protein
MSGNVVSAGQSINGQTLEHTSSFAYSVLAGGEMSNDTVGTFTGIIVSSGGYVSNDILSSGGIDLYDGALGSAIVIDAAGGLVAIESAASAVSTTVNSGGHFYNFGSATGVEVNNGGTMIDEGAANGAAPAFAISVHVNDRGRYYEDGHGTGTVVSFGGVALVMQQAGVALSTSILSGGSVVVAGTDIATTVGSGGLLTGEGLTSDVTVMGGGTLNVVGYGSSLAVTVQAGGRLFVSTFGAGVGATAVTVGSGGTVVVQGYTGAHTGAPFQSVVLDTTLLAGAGMSVSGGMGGIGIASGTTLDGGASATAENGGTLVDTTISGGSAVLLSGGSAAGGFDFAAGGSLVVSGGAVFGATVSGLNTTGSTIDFRGLADLSGGATASLNSTTDVLIVSGDTASVTVQLASGSYSGTAFSALADGSGGTLVQLACFARGTRIRTEAGEVAVETLAPGMPVALARGGVARVAWVGHRLVNCQKHPRPETVWPVRVAPDAFGPGMPARPLLLSPDHAVWVQGALIPIRYLVNGASIAQVECPSVEYWHVELPSHDVILAEGLAAESFLDTGNRGAFLNGSRAVQLHPDFAQRAWDSDACAPLAVAGTALERARAVVRAQVTATARPRRSV